jgi:predicted transposase/invertase (TIGR01784 family)
MLKERYINPFTDFGFKKLFGSEPNKDLLIDFLNELLPPEHRIVDLSYTPNERLGALELDRRAIFDLYCTGSNGDRFIVEMQKAKQNYFKDRSVFYASFPIQEQAQRGNWNFQLSAVYLIGILDFVFSEDEHEQAVRHEVKLKDQKDRVFYDKLTFIYLEMPNFKKQESELATNFDKWLYVLQRLPDLYERPSALGERVFKKLFQAAEIAKFSPEELRGYEESIKHYRDLKNVIDTSYGEGLAVGMEQGLQRGMEEGVKQGKEQGIEEGLKQGREEGLKQGREEEKQEMALKMLRASVSREVIAAATGWDAGDLDAFFFTNQKGSN